MQSKYKNKAKQNKTKTRQNDLKVTGVCALSGVCVGGVRKYRVRTDIKERVH